MFSRLLPLIGNDALLRLQQLRVLLFGVGGVGGWCAEALVRSGVTHLTIVDFDTVALSNLNRQVVATMPEVGRPKVEVMRERLLAINPEADIVAVNHRFTADDVLSEKPFFDFNAYDYVVDAIDSVSDKAELILSVSSSSAILLSSMGAGRKMDPSKVSVAEFWKVQGCPLARALRHKFKDMNRFPAKKFRAVYSPEISGESGTLVTVVATFGFRLAAEILNDSAISYPLTKYK